MKAVHIEAQEWIENFSIYAHRLGFNEERDKSRERISGAYLIVEDEPLGYATYIEMADFWAYVQFGAAFPSVRNSLVAFVGMKMIMDELKKKYSLLTLSVKNNNISALKSFFKLGFLVVGFKSIYDDKYVELSWEKQQ